MAQDKQTMTDIISLKYDFNTRKGEVFTHPLCFADTNGVIEKFQAIDPDVKMIKVWRGDGPQKAWNQDIYILDHKVEIVQAPSEEQSRDAN